MGASPASPFRYRSYAVLPFAGRAGVTPRHPLVSTVATTAGKGRGIACPSRRCLAATHPLHRLQPPPVSLVLSPRNPSAPGLKILVSPSPVSPDNALAVSAQPEPPGRPGEACWRSRGCAGLRGRSLLSWRSAAEWTLRLVPVDAESAQRRVFTHAPWQTGSASRAASPSARVWLDSPTGQAPSG